MEEDHPEWLKILDPYFSLENLINRLANGSFWPKLFEELTFLDSLQSIVIVTCQSYKDFVKANPTIRGLKDKGKYVSYEFQGYSEIVINAHHYNDPGSRVSPKSKYINLHDRWLIWGKENVIGALHFGSFQEDLSNKDLTVTKITDPTIASARFDEIVLFCEHKDR